MSQENVERVRRAYRLYQETQQPDYELLRRDVTWHTARDLPDSATYRGHDGVAELYSEWIGSFEDFRVEVEEIIDDGVWKLLDGKAVEIREYRTRAEALEAVGLRE